MRQVAAKDAAEVTTDVIGTLSSGAGKVGRYFTVVSALPSAVLIAYGYVLVQVSWSGPVRWSALAEVRWQDVLLAGLGALVLALMLNPLQFAMIQLFEGYWGRSALGVGLSSIRIKHHRRRLLALEKAERDAGALIAKHQPGALELSDPPAGLVEARTVAAENNRALASYPDLGEILPTRLGNVLRRYENSVGRPYGLEVLAAIPRIAMVGGEREIAYVQNQRVQLELAVRTAFVALCGTVLTIALMGRHGLWLLLAIVPYTVAYFAYRGAVALAHEYGMSLAVLTELGRFDLYKRMGLKLPKDTADERTMNLTLMRMFAFEQGSLPYVGPAGPPPAADPPEKDESA